MILTGRFVFRTFARCAVHLASALQPSFVISNIKITVILQELRVVELLTFVPDAKIENKLLTTQKLRDNSKKESAAFELSSMSLNVSIEVIFRTGF